MSTTSTSDAAIKAAFVAFPALVGMMFAGKLSGLNAELHNDAAAIESQGLSKIDTVHAKLDAIETSDPTVSAALTAGAQSIAITGLELPSETKVFNASKAGLKAFFDELLTA